MAYQNPGYKLVGHSAAVDLSDDQYKFVEVVAENSVNVADGTTTFPVGVLQNNPEADQEAEIMVTGVSKVKTSDDTISAGDLVSVDTDGTAIAAVSTDTAVGLALQGGVTGETVVIPVLIGFIEVLA